MSKRSEVGKWQEFIEKKILCAGPCGCPWERVVRTEMTREMVQTRGRFLSGGVRQACAAVKWFRGRILPTIKSPMVLIFQHPHNHTDMYTNIHSF